MSEPWARLPFEVHRRIVAQHGAAAGAVYVEYCIRADRSGVSWPSKAQIAAATGLSPRTVARARCALIACGEIRSVRRAAGAFGEQSAVTTVVAIAAAALANGPSGTDGAPLCHDDIPLCHDGTPPMPPVAHPYATGDIGPMPPVAHKPETKNQIHESNNNPPAPQPPPPDGVVDGQASEVLGDEDLIPVAPPPTPPSGPMPPKALAAARAVLDYAAADLATATVAFRAPPAPMVSAAMRAAGFGYDGLLRVWVGAADHGTLAVVDALNGATSGPERAPAPPPPAEHTDASLAMARAQSQKLVRSLVEPYVDVPPIVDAAEELEAEIDETPGEALTLRYAPTQLVAIAAERVYGSRRDWPSAVLYAAERATNLAPVRQALDVLADQHRRSLPAPEPASELSDEERASQQAQRSAEVAELKARVFGARA